MIPSVHVSPAKVRIHLKPITLLLPVVVHDSILTLAASNPEVLSGISLARHQVQCIKAILTKQTNFSPFQPP